MADRRGGPGPRRVRIRSSSCRQFIAGRRRAIPRWGEPPAAATWHTTCISRGLRSDRVCAERRRAMVIFVLGLMVGVALGLVVVGFLAIRAYDRGYDEALERRKAWRGELQARRVVAARGHAAGFKRAS